MMPFEIVMSPADIFIAYEGEAYPSVDQMPSGNWMPLGTAGKRNQAESGVTITHGQTLKEHFTTGSSGPVKVVRTAEALSIDIEIEDLTLEQYSKALNGVGLAAIGQAAGVAGAKVMPMRQGFDVMTFALLVRGPSPYGDGMNMQYQFPKVYQGASPAVKLNGNGDAATLKFQFKALEDPNADSDAERFGKLVAQNTFPA
jgi:hypothetical protein